MLHESFKVFQGSFNKTFKVFKKVSCCMALIAASRAEGGLVRLGNARSPLGLGEVGAKNRIMGNH